MQVDYIQLTTQALTVVDVRDMGRISELASDSTIKAVGRKLWDFRVTVQRFNFQQTNSSFMLGGLYRIGSLLMPRIIPEPFGQQTEHVTGYVC